MIDSELAWDSKILCGGRTSQRFRNVVVFVKIVFELEAKSYSLTVLEGLSMQCTVAEGR